VHRKFASKKAQFDQHFGFDANILTFCTSRAAAPFGAASFRVDRSAEKSGTGLTLGLNQPKAQ
jgi:hypothetical protein